VIPTFTVCAETVGRKNKQLEKKRRVELTISAIIASPAFIVELTR
jgi:hypothetical protein